MCTCCIRERRYGGVRLLGDSLVLAPQRPPGKATTLTIRGLSYRGWRLELTSTRAGYSLTAMSRDAGSAQLVARVGNGPPTPLVVGGRSVDAIRPTVMTLTRDQAGSERFL